MKNWLLSSTRLRALLCGFLLSLGVGFSAVAQGTVSGTVTDAETGETLIGASVVLEGTMLGAATDADGRFVIANVTPGSYALTVSFIGFESQTRSVSLGAGAASVTANFALEAANQALANLEVFASRAIDRKTPVAYSNIDKVQVQQQLGSRDIPLILNTTPSVYATAGGGGAGDARINVRGFDQRNTSVMINGVPVNDMENGWVYWSNWDGVGDAAASLQLQRGLSADHLSTPSIGGTFNILTDPAALRQGLTLKQEFGNDGFLKTTVVGSTGLIDNKFSLMALGVRKKGDGLVQGTWTDAWAYYVAASYNISNKNRLDLYALGAPQRHGQNLYLQNIGALNPDFARGLDDYDPAALETFGKCPAYLGGACDVDDSRRYNENFNSVASSYSGLQFANGDTFERYDRGFLNERENYFHKPQINLNWYSQFTDKLLLSTVVYYSGGKGGGTGTAGSLVWNYNGPSRIADWDATIARNQASATGSTGVLRNSVNNQWTVGAISKLTIEVAAPLSVEVGVDWRTAEIEHFREVRDLLGGAYFIDTSNDFADAQRGLGDKIAYNFSNTVDWAGTFVQGEYTQGPVSAYGMLGVSTIKYGYTNHFLDDGTGHELTAETDNIIGYQVKTGGLYNVNDQVAVFGNAGYVSKVPIFDGVIDDVGGNVNDNPHNESFLSFEAGAGFRSRDRRLSAKLNVYSTGWSDRTVTRSIILSDGTDGLINLTGLDARHQGVEAEVVYRPVALVRFNASGSLANWKYTNDVAGTYRPDDRSSAVEQFDFYVKDLKVGDAPQTQFAYAVAVFPTEGLYLQAVGKTFTNHYANFDPLDRTDPDDQAQSWKTPGYTVFDLHAGYTLPLQSIPVDLQIFGNVFNVFDKIYIQDALDNSPFNGFDDDHDADDAEVYLGLPRTFTLGFKVTY